MLKKNININRKSNELSQDELAIKFNVLRQTVLKWERGLSVLDSEMLISYRKYQRFLIVYYQMEILKCQRQMTQKDD